MTEKKFLAIKKSLKKKKEKIILDLIIKDYDKSNFYIALLFDKKIEKFKVLFVPIDAVDVKNIDEYFCYQFINVGTVNYFLETISKEEDVFKEESFRNRLSKTMDAYYIEINININGQEYKFLTNQIIPKEWDFLFGIIVALFEHLPNVVSELCNKILALFNDFFGHIKYDYSLEIDENRDDLGLFDSKEMKLAQKLMNKIEFAEKIRDKYICIIGGNVFIFTVDTYNNIFNAYVENKSLGREYIYVLYLVYKNNLEKKFVKIILDDNNKLFCYKIDNDELIIIDNYEKQRINLTDLVNRKIKIIDGNKEFNQKLEMCLKEKAI